MPRRTRPLGRRASMGRIGMSDMAVVDLVKQGVELARAGDKSRARPLFRQAVEDDPANEPALMWLASVAESPQEALTTLERVLALNPNHEQAHSAAHAARLKVGVAAAKAHKKSRAREVAPNCSRRRTGQ